jgi:hypothetical protein
MKLTICLEIDDNGLQSGTAASALTSAGDSPQRDMSRRVSANFVTHLAATFLQCPQTCARRRMDLYDAIQIYNNVSVAKSVPVGNTAIRRKT